MREPALATVIAEIKNAFVNKINDTDLIELLYRGVTEPLGIKVNKVQKGAAGKIVNRELEDYKTHLLETAGIPRTIIKEERAYTIALPYAQCEKMDSFPLVKISDYPVYEKYFSEQRKYYFAAESVRRGTRDIYDKED